MNFNVKSFSNNSLKMQMFKIPPRPMFVSEDEGYSIKRRFSRIITPNEKSPYEFHYFVEGISIFLPEMNIFS